MMKKALICLDVQDMKRSAELLEIINRIYKEKEVLTYAVVFGKEPELEGNMFHVVHRYCAEEGQIYDMRWMASCMKELHDTEQFSCIIVPATCWGRMLAPVIAMKLDTGLVADVTEVSEEGGVIQMIRPAFEGKLMAQIVNQDGGPVVMSVRLGVFSYGQRVRRASRIFVHNTDPKWKSGIKLIEKSEKAKGEDIRDARILVSGGGGVWDYFPKIQKLANLLGGMAASSRRLVDGGVTSREIQVGQSGKIVSPELYIAIGIYGSMQHMEGLKNVDYIISVNTNRNAPICSLSTIVVEGDAAEFMEKLTKKIIKIKSKENSL